jgi:SAM-dependent methyltransferase
MRDALRGRLPPRYVREFWWEPFHERVLAELAPGQAILDVGSGRAPTVPPAERLDGSSYVGLDLSAAELATAPAGSYDQMVTGDVSERMPALDGQFDLAVSYQVFEHVRRLPAALDNIRHYLRPGGVMVAQLSGAFSLFGLGNRAVPASLGVKAMERFLHRDPETVFPAHYDRCWDSALRRDMASWQEVEIMPLYTGAGYLGFARSLQALYIGFEELAYRRDRRNLASYYVIVARA